MGILQVYMFGQLRVHHEDRLLNGFEPAKVAELFCYLLLYRDRPQPRDTLATLLWGDNTTAQAKKYLRQTLWHLQDALEVPEAAGAVRVLQVGLDCVGLNTAA